MKVLGVDAGKSGALAFYDTSDGSFIVDDIPLDSSETLDSRLLFLRLLDWEPKLIVVEDCWRPKSLVRMVGEVAAIGKILEAEVKVVAVVSWKTKILNRNTSDKKVSIESCLQRQPTILPQLIPPGCRKPKADRAEAVLLALYGASL